VRLLGEPSLWCWELRDAADGTLVESSWSAYWTAFETRDEARAEGLRRLADLVIPGGVVDRADAIEQQNESRAIPPAV
jgi:hypothetical protein